MIPFCNGNAVLTTILNTPVNADTLNEDHNWYLSNAPVATPTSWTMRLLPAFVRTQIKARQAARAYESKLIEIWETSPHLLDDIGVVLSTDGNVPADLHAAPASVVDHVNAITQEKASVAAVTPADETPVAPVRVVVPSRKQKVRAGRPAAVPAWA